MFTIQSNFPKTNVKALRFLPINFLLFSLIFKNQPTALSSRAEDGHQMYSEGSDVDKASTIGIETGADPEATAWGRGLGGEGKGIRGAEGVEGVGNREGMSPSPADYRV